MSVFLLSINLLNIISSDLDQFLLSETEDSSDECLNDLDIHVQSSSIDFSTAINVKLESGNRYVYDNKQINFKDIDYSKDNYILVGQGSNSNSLWSTKQPIRNKKLRKDSTKVTPGLTSYSQNAKTYLDTFKLFISDNITNDILRYTNQALEASRKEKSNDDHLYRDINYNELLSYYGTMIAMGYNKDNTTSLNKLWKYDDLMNGSIYNLIMSRERFKVIHEFIRFDNPLTTDARKVQNKLAKVSEMMDRFNENCINAMDVGESLTVDEQLLKLHCRFGFRQYIPSKPAKYGIKSKIN